MISNSLVENPLVTVIVLAYNQPEFLNQAIESVCAQTFSDYELLVIDDCSGEDITNQYRLPENARLICLHEHFGGDTRGRNVGVKEAKGKYIAFLDNDDVWFPDKLETQVRLLDDNPDAVLVYSHYIVTDSSLTPRPKQDKFELPAPDMIRQLIHGCFIHSPSAVLIKRDVIIKNGCFDESLLSGTDWDMWRRLSTKFRFVPDPIPRIYYRIHSAQISENFEKKAFFRVKGLTKTLEQMKLNSPKHVRYARIRLSWALRKFAKLKMAKKNSLSEIKPLLLHAIAVWPWNIKSYLLLAWLPFYAAFRRSNDK
ncbi:MAG: glycosyltransferase family A protein [bacterium]